MSKPTVEQKYSGTSNSFRYDWGPGRPRNCTGNDNYSVRFSRRVYSGVTGTYTFRTTNDDGVRLYVDGHLIINRWIDQAPTSYSGSIYLTAGYHDLRMDYYEKGGGAHAALSWSIRGPPTRIDIAEYVGKTDGQNGPVYWLTLNEKMQIQVANMYGRSGFYQVKNGNWEEFTFDGNYVYRHRDISEGPNLYYCLYNANWQSGAPWIKRHMNLNEKYNIRGNIKHFWQDTCQVRINDQGHKMEGGMRPEVIILEEIYSSYNLGGRSYPAIRLKSYNTSYNDYKNHPYEEWIYAKGVGLVAWTNFINPRNTFARWESGPGPVRATLKCP